MKIPYKTAHLRTAGIAMAGFSLMLGVFALNGGPGVAAQQQQQQSAPQQGAPATPSAVSPMPPQQGAAPADAPHGAAPGPLVAYPDRPKAPQAVLDKGKATFSVNCAFCHGSDAGGGSVGPNLLRSEVVLQDKRGELIGPIVHGARQAQGMPKIDISDEQIAEVADWLHSLKTGGNMRSTEKINIVVGDANAGKAAFDKTCGSCHSVSGDLKGFAAKFTDPRAMQQAWLLPGFAGGRQAGPAVKLNVPPITATVTTAAGKKTTGRLDSLDDFFVAVTTDDGVVHRFTREDGMPKVEVHDPVAAHRELFRTYKDKDIHDITAYLVSLK